MIFYWTEHGYLRGKRQVQHTPVNSVKAEEGEAVSTESKLPPSPSTLIDVIVETVSKCSDETDDGVQLQVWRPFVSTLFTQA